MDDNTFILYVNRSMWLSHIMASARTAHRSFISTHLPLHVYQAKHEQAEVKFASFANQTP
ncbi:hypothetical protein NC653_004524 [Populus alba x Populus x berolinensis]|uniref:Uncharacterized protein n=1 Tax=Populus alba x Populus x berolinensis TaxID=444605 RepID=A0AAD6RU66_9ROSI|nr:hypothetical protein NC653_004524 [Populus alba x Populus x berolinensis]